MSPMAPLIYSSSAVVLTSMAAVCDMRTQKIPNWLTGPAILGGLLLHLALGGFTQLGWSLLAGVVAGSVFLLFYLAGGMGAGDVKLITAVGCIVGISAVKDVLLVTMVAGAVFAVAVAVYRGKVRETVSNVIMLIRHHKENGLTPHGDLHVANRLSLRLPYALPIAAGCVFTLVLGLTGIAKP